MLLAQTHRRVFEAALDASAPLELQACILGGDDMAASLGATRTASNAELQWARQAVVVHCRAYKLPAIDIVKVRSWVGGRQLRALHGTLNDSVCQSTPSQ